MAKFVTALGHDLRKKLMFQFQHRSLEVFRFPGRGNRQFFLKNDLALVIDFIDIVDGDTGMHLPGGYYSPVDLHAIHPFAAKFGQQGRMNIENAFGELLYHFVRQVFEISRQHDEFDPMGQQKLLEVGAILVGLAGKVDDRNLKGRAKLKNARPGIVGQ